jgi:PhzF family phenazine biosynthesis protein
MLGVIGPYRAGARCDFEVRVFGPRVGVYEDPVTGSFNAGVAQWLIGAGAAPRAYAVSQGARLGRRGVVQIAAADAGTVWVGGASTTCIRGSVML